MGKSTTALAFRGFGLPLFDADLAVHDLMGPGGRAVAAVLDAFPETGDACTGIDRKKLGARVLGNPPALTRLEAILHPAVREAERRFLQRASRNGDRIVVLDVPLLFETRGERRCDATVVVSAPPALQRARALARPGMTPERLDAILRRQIPDALKRRRADFVVRSGAGRAQALADVTAVLKALSRRTPRRWPEGWLTHSQRRTARGGVGDDGGTPEREDE